MSSLLRRARTVALVLTCALALPAASALAGPAASPHTAVPIRAQAGPPTVGGVALRYLPAGLGTTSDFSYDYDDVDMTSRVWESHSGTDPDHGWQVDLDVTVMHGARLTGGKALHDWFIAYEERDPEPTYRAIRVHGRPGWICRDQVFWLVERGAAVSVTLDPARWSSRQVLHIATAADTAGV